MTFGMQKVSELTSGALTQYLLNRRDGRMVEFLATDPTDFTDQMDKIWVNTTDKLIKYTSDGGVTITTTGSNEDEIFFNIKDYGATGDGIADDYPALNTLITAIGSAQATIVFPVGTYRMGSSITIPSNVCMYILNGSMLAPDSGDSVTINGTITAGLWQIFAGSGTISGNMKVDVVYPQWWGAKGDGTTDDTAALQKLINTAIASGRKAIFFPHTSTGGEYFVTALTNDDQVEFFGDNASFIGGYYGIIRQLGDWVSTADGAINLHDYCVLDGVADDSTGLETAAALALSTNRGLYLPTDKTLRLTRDITITARIIDFQGIVKIDYTGNGLTIRANRTEVTPRKIFIRHVLTGAGVIGIRLCGHKNSEIAILFCDYIQLFADAADDDIKSMGYNNFRLGKVSKLEFKGNPLYSGGSGLVDVQWINENNFFGGRFKSILMDPALQQSHNKWISPLLEDCTISLYGDSHILDYCRMEGTNIITFGAGSMNNKLIKSMAYIIFDEFNEYGAISNTTITDNGEGNLVTQDGILKRDMQIVGEVSHRSKIINSSLGLQKAVAGAVSPGLHKQMIATDFREIFNTGMIPWTDEVFWMFISDATSWRVHIFVYDSNMQLILTEPPEKTYVFTTEGSFSNGEYRVTNNNFKFRGIILNPDGRLAYYKVVVNTGSSTAGSWFDYASLHCSLKRDNRITRAYSQMSSKLPVVSDVITKGFGELGEIVPKTTGGYYQCTFSLDTVHTTDVEAGATSLNLSVFAGIAVGDIIGILLDDLTTHWTTVSSVSSSLIGLTVATPSASTGTKQVVLSRWV